MTDRRTDGQNSDGQDALLHQQLLSRVKMLA